MSKKRSLGGDDKGPSFASSFYDPLTGGYGSEVRYKQYVDVGKRQSNWLPRGLTMRQVRDGDTAGYKRKRAGEGVPGWVWVKS